MCLLAVDPGLTCTAACIIPLDGDGIPDTTSWRFGTRHGTVEKRIALYCDAVAELFDEHHPLVYAVESGYVPSYRAQPERRELPEVIRLAAGIIDGYDHRGREGKAAAALKTAELRGRLIGLADGTDCEVIRVAPATASAAMGLPVRLKRRQRKAEMQQMVKLLYGLDLNQDEADAVGIAEGARRILQDRRVREAVR